MKNVRRLTYLFKETQSSSGILETLANTDGFEYLQGRQHPHMTVVNAFWCMKLMSVLESDEYGFRIDEGIGGAMYICHPKVEQMIQEGVPQDVACERVFHPVVVS